MGSQKLLRDSYQSIKNRRFALDYIALLAIITSLITGHFSVALVVTIMMSGGNSLEDYAANLASRSLSNLLNRIPQNIDILNGRKRFSTPVTQVSIGTTILVRKGEVVPLDGHLLSAGATVDQSSLTGESFPTFKTRGSLIKSGVVNVGNLISIKTTTDYKSSTYHQIIGLVENAKNSKAPFTRLADSLSGWFTIVTILLAISAYFVSGDLTRVLAVLVIATPCPLILAAPIAFVGGISKAAKQQIIVKSTESFESLAKVKSLVFDKTGTLTLGEPKLESFVIKSNHHTEKEIFKIVYGLEQNSFHPFAKSLVKLAQKKQIKPANFQKITEIVGMGISGSYKGSLYSLTKNPSNHSQIVLKHHNHQLAIFTFADNLKHSAVESLLSFKDQGYKLFVLTGDSEEKANQIRNALPVGTIVHAQCTPQEKRKLLQSIKKSSPTAMVGDGLNDAPALAFANVGLVFSQAQKTASTEAADIVLMGNSINLVQKSLDIAKQTYRIAKQSMYAGLLLSLVGMFFAFRGYLSPILGSITQEFIDVAVILNALRSLKIQKTLG